MAQAIGRSMANLVVLERHLWLNLTEIKDMDKLPQPQALKSLPHETTVQDGYFEADPLVHLSRPYSPSITGKS